MTLLGLVIAVIVLLLAIIALIIVFSRGHHADRGATLTGLALAAVVVVVMAAQIAPATSLPQIHNISTDTADPPQFDKIVALRGEGSNPLEYNSAALADVQRAAYPDVQPLQSADAPAVVLARARDTLSDMGMEIVNEDAAAGIVEATATTFWFGFKDDVVVRVRPAGSGSVVDVRSVSRVGLSDLGANAARIMKFRTAFGGG